MRWGAASAKRRLAALGAPAAIHRLHLRAGDRGAGSRAVRGRRHPRRRRHARPPLHGAGDLIRVRRFDDYAAALREGEGRARRRPPQGDHPGRRARPRLRARAGAGRGRGAARGGRRPGRMAGGADGRVRAEFLDIPPEVIRATIRANQKCFVLRDPATGALANHFILVSNIEASDGGKARSRPATSAWCARASPTRSISGRPTSATCPTTPTPENAGKPLDQRLAKLKKLDIVFHEKLGTQGERVERIARWRANSRRWSAPTPSSPRARRELCQGRSRHRDGRRVPRSAGPDGPPLRRAAGRARQRRRRDRGTLQAAGAVRPRADGPGVAWPWRWPTSWTRWSASGRSTRSRPGARTLCAAPGGAGRDAAGAGEWAAVSLA